MTDRFKKGCGNLFNPGPPGDNQVMTKKPFSIRKRASVLFTRSC